jgi:SAM-dependent methyltransferase
MISGFGPVPADELPDPEVSYWETAAEDYYRQHGAFLGDDRLMWCPEGLDEDAVHLLGDVCGQRVLEIGCGAAQGSRWAARAGARVVGLDLSYGMLRVGQRLGTSGFDLVQSDAARLPFVQDSFDLVFTAMGALQFVPSVAAVYAEVARVLRAGGRWVFATSHPFAWVFPDSPHVEDLSPIRRYFDRSAYFERSDDGRLIEVQRHTTLAGHLGGLITAGFLIDQVIEPEWLPSAAARDGEWAAWSPARAEWLPSTLIIASHLPT